MIKSYDLKSIEYLHQITENLLHIRAEIDDAVFYKQMNQTIESIQKIEKYDKEAAALLEVYGQLEHTPEIKDSYNEILKLFEEYKLVRDKVLALARAGDYIQAEAGLPSIIEIRIELNKKLDSLVDVAEYNAMIRNDKNRETYYTMSNNILIGIIVGAGLAITVGLMVALSMGKRIKNILLFAQAIGEGDLTYSANVTGKDEMAKLSDVLNVSREKLRRLVLAVSKQTQEVSASSEELSAILEEISSTFGQIDQNTSSIVSSIQNINTMTEELIATVEQVDAGVYQLITNSMEGNHTAIEIKQRSMEIKNKEAARAGEHGRGFA